MLNVVVEQGRLATEPELRYTANKVPVVTIRIAVDRNYSGQGKEREADFFNVVVWRATAEFVCRNFHKGDAIIVRGRLENRVYTDRSGNKREIVEIVGENVYFSGRRRSTDTQAAENVSTVPQENPGIDDLLDEEFDDLPFEDLEE